MKNGRNNRELVYLKIHKDDTEQIDSKFEGCGKFNIMKLPKGVIVGECDLSYGVLNPKIMYQDHINPSMMVAQYDKTQLEDEAVVVNLRKGKHWEKIKVDVEILSEKVEAINKEYLLDKENKENIVAEDTENTIKEHDYEHKRNREIIM